MDKRRATVLKMCYSSHGIAGLSTTKIHTTLTTGIGYMQTQASAMLVPPLLPRNCIPGEFVHRTFWRNGKCESHLQIYFKVNKKTR